MIAVTGATGYVGGRLVQSLLEAGYRVRCIVREPRKLSLRPWADDPRVSIAKCDLAEDDNLHEHLAGCDAAYYLIHSMELSGSEYADRDRKLATRFVQAAEHAGISRIIYLGGLGEMGEGLSEHLSSRREVEHILSSSSIPMTAFRAAMIIGSGSASFEILRYLVERLPVMITPKWVRTESQPIAIADVLHWLVRCLSVPETENQTF
ncbi:MAG: NmrA family NAD(P)-binding protein, partial [Phycisphaerales bacterium]